MDRKAITGKGKRTGNKYVIGRNLFDDWCVRINDGEIYAFGSNEKHKTEAFKFVIEMEKGDVEWGTWE